MKETNPSWKDQQKQPTNYGVRLQELQKEERAKGGVLDMETEVVIRSYSIWPRIHR